MCPHQDLHLLNWGCDSTISFHQSKLLTDVGKAELMFLPYASSSPCVFVRRIKLMYRSCLKINFTKNNFISARSLTDPTIPQSWVPASATKSCDGWKTGYHSFTKHEKELCFPSSQTIIWNFPPDIDSVSSTFLKNLPAFSNIRASNFRLLQLKCCLDMLFYWSTKKLTQSQLTGKICRDGGVTGRPKRVQKHIS